MAKYNVSKPEREPRPDKKPIGQSGHKDNVYAGLIEAYRGKVSLPFPLGTHERIAVKIVDDRGIESLKIVEGAES